MTTRDASAPTSLRDGDARAAVADLASAFAEFDAGVVSTDPLGWPGYPEQLERARARSGEPESVICGDARIGRVDAVLIAFDFRFMGGSMGEATGQRITDAFARATRARRPIVSLVTSGG